MRRLLPVLLLCLTLAPSSSRAQAAPALESLELSLWPEYDRPATLVIVRGHLSAEVALPMRVALPLPATVDSPHAVAVKAADGQLLNATWSIEGQGEQRWVAIEATTQEVRLEYYAPLDARGARRSGSWRWPGGATVGGVVFEVQQPRGARDLVVSPTPGTQQERLGMLHQVGQLPAIGAGATAEISFAYERDQPGLSQPPGQPPAPALATPAVPAVAPLTEPAATSPQHPPARWALPAWMPGLLGAALGAIVALLVVRRRGAV